MKLFKSLLVAPAALGLLSPLTASASEVNLNDISTYSNDGLELSTETFNPLSTVNPLLAGGEGLNHLDHDGSFSSTTTATFSADFAIGAVDGGSATNDDAVNFGYGFQIDLNTSFTGEDSLDISIDAGTTARAGYDEFDLNDASETLTVDGISYTFPLGDKTTVMIGDTVDGSSLFSIACVYGTPSNTMDDCGAVDSAFVGQGTTLAASYDFDNGFYTSFGYAGAGDSTNGLMTKEGLDSYGFNAAYTGDNYGLSLSYALVEATTTSDDTSTALNAYWTPDGFPSISVGYEWTDDGSAATTADEKTGYFVGVQFEEVGPGTLGFALGTKTPTVEGTDELLMYEAFYSYSVNDGMTITPLVYVKEFATGTDDETGVMVKTSFSF